LINDTNGNKPLENDIDKIINNDDKPRENEFLRDFCIWRKKNGLFVPVSWEK